jgi:hypothetical protein
MAKQLAKTLMLPDAETIRDLETAKRAIRAMIEELRGLNETLYGVVADHESRLAAGGL